MVAVNIQCLTLKLEFPTKINNSILMIQTGANLSTRSNILKAEYRIPNKVTVIGLRMVSITTTTVVEVIHITTIQIMINLRNIMIILTMSTKLTGLELTRNKSSK